MNIKGLMNTTHTLRVIGGIIGAIGFMVLGLGDIKFAALGTALVGIGTFLIAVGSA